MKTKRIQLVDAQQMSKEHPDTFDAPSLSVLRLLRAGDMVKVCDNRERFWVEIISRRGDIFTARVVSPVLFTSVDMDDFIQFHSCNVFDIS